MIEPILYDWNECYGQRACAAIFELKAEPEAEEIVEEIGDWGGVTWGADQKESRL